MATLRMFAERFRRAPLPGVTAGPFALLVAGLAAAVVAGMVTAMIGSQGDSRAAYYVAVFASIIIGGVVAVTRKEPLRFTFLALILLFPIATALVPPGRLEITVFDVIMCALTIGLLRRKVFASPEEREPFFPTPSLLVACLLCIPCIVLSQFPFLSLQVSVLRFFTYAFFILALSELWREKGFERLVLLFSIVTLFMAIGLFIDHFLHVNLSLRGSNLNQLTYVSGLQIYRAGGFFQDPQRAGAFLACMITFLLLLSIRGRFRGMNLRFVVWAAIAVSCAALITTISRSAILACLFVSGVALFASNRWNALAKLAVMGSAVIVAIVVTLTPADMWLSIVPATVSERFQRSNEEFDNRLAIWFDTWDMFADHPLTGIGAGSFRSYLIETRPTTFNYYDIGTAEGVIYIPDQPENGYLKILYEGGILGSIAALLVVGDALRRGIGVIARSNTDPDARTEGIAALAGLMVFGITFVTLYTLGDPRMAAVFLFFLALIWHRSIQREQIAAKA